MPEREKVINGLTDIYDEAYSRWVHCQYTRDKLLMIIEKTIPDALALLKEQETGVSPKEIKMYPNNVWACGSCGHVAVGSLTYKAKYCPECGRKVQWNA